MVYGSVRRWTIWKIWISALGHCRHSGWRKRYPVNFGGVIGESRRETRLTSGGVTFFPRVTTFMLTFGNTGFIIRPESGRMRWILSS